MGDEAFARRTDGGVVEFVLRVVQLCLQVVTASDHHIQFPLGTEVTLDQLGDPGAIGLGGNQLCLEGFHPVFERCRVDAKQHIAFFQGLVGLHRYIDHLAADHGYHRNRYEIGTRHLGVGVVVVHRENQRADNHDPAQHRRGHRPFVQGDAEDLEDGYAESGIRQNE
ncbi:hypothetical protein D3C71_1303010 [compost metagenome]